MTKYAALRAAAWLVFCRPSRIGQRMFFLHDGRTSDLLQAIEAHAGCTGARGHDQDRDHHRFNNCDSEAYRVLVNFNVLSPSQQQDILNFLRSL